MINLLTETTWNAQLSFPSSCGTTSAGTNGFPFIGRASIPTKLLAGGFFGKHCKYVINNYLKNKKIANGFVLVIFHSNATTHQSSTCTC